MAVYWCYIGIMEKNMKTTIVVLGIPKPLAGLCPSTEGADQAARLLKQLHLSYSLNT